MVGSGWCYHAPMTLRPRYWETKALADMSDEEWEALCDGCGRCCLVKLEDEDTGEYHATSLACFLLDEGTCRCRDYANRQKRVPDCVKLDHRNVTQLGWMPASCAYRRVAEGRGLAWWHPLVSGTFETVEDAGISVKGQFLSEEGIPEEDFVDYIRTWPEWTRE